jgi:DNA polymerase-1
MTCNCLLIDGFSVLYRAYYGYPSNFTTPAGVPINAVFGFVTLMLNAIDQLNPTHVAVCMDRKEPTVRHQLYPQYKAHRPPPDDSFLIQLPEFRQVMASFDVPLLELPGVESDDLLGTLAKFFDAQSLSTIIMSGDLDLLQLVNDSTHVLTNTKMGPVIYTPKKVMDRYGISPHQIIDYKSLKGDASDNIPGVKGVGDKTALKLLLDFGSLDGIYNNVSSISSASLKNKLIDHKEMAFLSQKLVTIDCHAPIEISLESMVYSPPWPAVAAEFSRLDFKRLMGRIPKGNSSNDVSFEVASVPLFREPSVAHIASITQLEPWLILLNKGFAFDLETTSLDPHTADIVAISITASAGISVVIDCRSSSVESAALFNWSTSRVVPPLLAPLVPLFENPAIPKILHNAKYETKVLKSYGINLQGIYFDTMIAAYVLNQPSVQLKSLAKLVFNYDMLPFTALIEPYDSIDQVPSDALMNYVANDSNATFALYQHFDALLTHRLRDLYFSIEMPLISVLAHMEWCGVACDVHYLKALSTEYSRACEQLQRRIYSLSGDIEFNVNSTKQLAEVLFDRLQLPVIKKTKTGRSTDSSVLDELAKDYPIAQVILEYRLYKKLLSTYIDRLPELMHPKTQKIHTSFNQAVTATGRLSSNEPNLQNIPVRSPAGQKIRCAFVSRFEDGRIVSVDYSQIELRVLAHLSNDPGMIQAFLNNEDIHQATASKVFRVPYDLVTKAQREQAKTVNFGITYGQSAFALSNQLGISRSDAQGLINDYFDQFSSIQTFIDDTIGMAEAQGQVETMCGRRRLLPDIASPVRSIKQNAERIAVNTRVQGSAADIIKKAMGNIQPIMALVQSELVMQVHDELVFDIHPAELDGLIPPIVQAMSDAVRLQVPLIVDVESAPHWGGGTG